MRLTNWRSAPELDNDYEARPANGWDVRAEGWLPAWPHLGGKLVYEQYYGDEVALFDKDEIFSSAFQTRYFTSTLSGVYTTIGSLLL